MINRVLTALCLLLSIIRAGAQNQHVIPPSPTASALASYVDNPVSLYTGTPEINIPLYNLQVKDFELPVSLSYHSKGMKVDETASNVGMGWSLNAGGVITRSVKGFPDDYKAPACGPSNYDDCRNGLFYSGKNTHDINLTDIYNNTLSNLDYSFTHLFSRYFEITYCDHPQITCLISQLEDTEPDIFYFNFCGHQGKFVFEVINGVRTIRLMPHQDLKISYSFDSNHGIIEFKVTDNNGIIYTFSAQELTEYRVVNNGWGVTNPYEDGMNWAIPPVGYSAIQYHSSWYLSKIETPLGSSIDLSYETESYLIHNEGPELTMLRHTGSDSTYNPNTGPVLSSSLGKVTDIMVGKRLSRIETTDIRIDFQTGPDRQDVIQSPSNKAKPINGLTVYYKRPLGQPLKRICRWAFSQTHFLTNMGSTALDKRLFLQSIRRYGATNDSYEPSTVFEYKYTIYTGNSEHWLPQRMGKSQDLWGYYNAAPANNTYIPALYIYPDMYNDSRRFSVYRRHLHTGREYYLPGADRLPNRHFMDIGMLTRVKHPTGGHTTYEYEPHIFQDDNEVFSGGGLRIKKITKYDGISAANNLVYDYSYNIDGTGTSGALISMPAYAVFDGGGFWYALDNSKRAYQGNTIRFSHPQAPLGTTQGSNIGYRQVTERITGKGKTVHHYALPAYWHQPNDMNGPSGCDPLVDGYCDGLYQLTPVQDIFVDPGSGYADKNNYDFGMNPAAPNTYPFPENPNYDWNRGHLLRKEIYNEANTLAQKEDYTYSLYFPQGKTTPTLVYGLKFGRIYPKYTSRAHSAPYAICLRAAKYHYLTGVAKVPASVTTTRYDQDNPAKSISTTTWYTYGSTRVKKLTEKRTEQSDGSQLVSKYKYAADYFPSSPPPDEGVSIPLIKQMQGTLVEEAQFVRRSSTDRLIGGQLTTFHEYISQPVLYGRYTLQTASPQSSYTASEYQGPVFSFNSRYQRDLLCRRYDSQGNLLEASTPDDTRICYVWGYQRRYPVAKVINATYNEIEALLTSNDFSYLMNGAMVEIFGPGYPPEYMHTPEDIRLIINKLRTGLPNAQVYTYTYDPLIGLRSETSPAGITTSYEYDDMGRLQAVKDHDGNILETYEYHYKGH